MYKYVQLLIAVITMMLIFTDITLTSTFVNSKNDTNYFVQILNETAFMTNANGNQTVVLFNITDLNDIKSIVPNANLTLVKNIDPGLIDENETIFIFNASDPETGDLVNLTVPSPKQMSSPSVQHFSDPHIRILEKVYQLGLCESGHKALEFHCSRPISSAFR